MRRIAILCGFLWVGWADAEDLDQATLKWSAAAEGAAVKLKNAARDLAGTAAKVEAEGRIGWLPVLRSQADEVARRAELLERLTGGEAEASDSPEAPEEAPPSTATTPVKTPTVPH